MSRGRAAGVAVALLGVMALCWWGLTAQQYVNPPLTPLAERPDPGDAPNVVLVIGCTVRRDQLSPYGGPRRVTPFLAELAAGGARFDDAIAASSWTKASTVAMITGQPAISVGMVEPRRRRNERALHPDITTLAEYFVAAGYETIGATANPNLNTVFGMAQGFDGYRDTDGRIVEGKLTGDDVVARTLELVDGRKDRSRPLFVRAMFVDAHVPRALPEDEYEMFRGDGISRELAEYRGQLHRFDTALRTLDAGLRERGLNGGNTIWVVVADHGEGLSLPDHHRGHGRALYSSMIRVPWLVRGPGIPSGSTVYGLASLVDLPRTVLGLAGVEGPAYGEDWSRQVRGEEPFTTRYLAFSDTWFYEVRRSAAWSATEACQRDFGSTGEPFEGIFFEDGCFRRRTDPDFVQPIPPTALMTELEQWRAARMHEAEAFRLTGDATVSDKLSGQLEALGYVD